jgi:NADH:ubiquinone oxidoreductase subunit 6 (subunit J)
MPVRSSTLSCLYLLFLFLFSSFFASEEFSFATCMSLEAFVHVLGFILRFIVMMKEALQKLDRERSIFRSVGLSVYVLKFLVRVCGMLCSSSRWFLHIGFLFSFYTAI